LGLLRPCAGRVGQKLLAQKLLAQKLLAQKLLAREKNEGKNHLDIGRFAVALFQAISLP